MKSYEDWQEAQIAYDSEAEEEQIKANFAAQDYEFVTKVHDRSRPGYWRLQFGKPKQ
jgi:hypothetical protein